MNRIFDLRQNCVVGQHIAFRVSRRAVEGTKRAISVADVRVVDGALDGVSDDLVIVLAVAHFRCGGLYNMQLGPIQILGLFTCDSMRGHISSGSATSES